MPGAAVTMGSNFQGSLLDMVFNAGVMVQFVLFLLLFFSVVSWAIILMKYRIIRKARRENASFIDIYMKNTKLSDVFSVAKRYEYSTVAEVFKAGYAEHVNLNKFLKESPSGEGVPFLETRGMDSVERSLYRASMEGLGRLESALGFLATTGSVSPFIGLFGTVWGIMDTFRGIGARGSATLAVVAPGISEALIATAAGLLAAIPAVVFYNYFQNSIKAIALDTDSFVSELLRIIERQYSRR